MNVKTGVRPVMTVSVGVIAAFPVIESSCDWLVDETTGSLLITLSIISTIFEGPLPLDCWAPGVDCANPLTVFSLWAVARDVGPALPDWVVPSFQFDADGWICGMSGITQLFVGISQPVAVGCTITIPSDTGVVHTVVDAVTNLGASNCTGIVAEAGIDPQ
jgi:hypothetical protein